MHKRLILYVIFVALFIFAQKSLAATLTASSSGSYIVGDTFNVQVLLNTQSVATDGVDLHYLRFNNAALKLNSVTLGVLYSTTMTNTIDNNNGTYNFSQVAAGGASYNGSGTLLTLNFQALSAGTAVVAFDYTAGATTDCNIAASGVDVLNQVSGASFTITANQPPTITAASANPASGNTPLTVGFTSAATDPNGDLFAYSWNFGDGATSSLQNPSHIYTTAGNYTAALTVTDVRGGAVSRSLAISVTSPPNQMPTATASANPVSGTAPLTVQLTGSGADTDGTIASYSWTFGDGGTAATQSPSHIYTTAGNFTAVLTVTDNRGGTGSKSVSVAVSSPANQAPTATASANPTSGTTPLVVQFTGSGADTDGTIASYSWTFGDATANSSLQSPSHTFTSPGQYQVYLIVGDDQGAFSSQLIYIVVSAATVSSGGGGGGGTVATASNAASTTNQASGGGMAMATTSATKPLNEEMSIEELKAELARITALIAQLQAQLLAMLGKTSTIQGIPAGFAFAKILKLGMINSEVKYLQIVLNSDSATQVTVSGKGSSGKENNYFGNLTKAAVIRFQEKYRAEILTPIKLSKGTGIVSFRTIQKLNQILPKQ